MHNVGKMPHFNRSTFVTDGQWIHCTNTLVIIFIAAFCWKSNIIESQVLSPKEPIIRDGFKSVTGKQVDFSGNEDFKQTNVATHINDNHFFSQQYSILLGNKKPKTIVQTKQQIKDYLCITIFHKYFIVYELCLFWSSAANSQRGISVRRKCYRCW